MLPKPVLVPWFKALANEGRLMALTNVARLMELAEKGDKKEIVRFMEEVVPGYRPNNGEYER